MKKAVIESAYMTMSSGLSVKESVILKFAQYDAMDAALLIAGYHFVTDKEAGILSMNALLHGNRQEFPGDVGIDRHGFLYISPAAIKTTQGPAPKWIRSSKALAEKKMSHILKTMQDYADSKKGGPNV